MIAIEEQMKKVLEEAKVVKEVADQIIGQLLEDEKKKIFDQVAKLVLEKSQLEKNANILQQKLKSA